MTCQQASKELKALQDGELSPLLAWRARRHLRACPDCRREMDALERVGELVKALEVSAVNGLVQEFHKPSPALREKTLERFRAERSEAMNPPASKPQRPAPRRFRPKWQYIGVAASLLVVWGLAYPFLTARKSASPGMESLPMKAEGGMMAGEGMQGGSGGMMGGGGGMPGAGGGMMGMMGKGPGTMELAQAPAAARSMPAPSGPSADSAPAIGRASRKVIQTASISLEVVRFQEAYDRVMMIGKRYGGFVFSSSSQSDDQNYKSGEIILKVPGESFERAIKDISSVGEVLTRQLSGEDVTDEFVDTQARIRNLKRSEERYLAILKQVKKLNDILRLEQELTRVRSEIESLTSRLLTLERMSALSTITVSLTERRQVPLQKKTGWNLANTVREAWNSMSASIEAIISLLIWLLVYSPFWGTLVFLGYMLYRKYTLPPVEEEEEETEAPGR